MLTGAWHGAAWNFVLWGLLYAVLLLLEKWVPALQRLPAVLRHGYVMLAVCLGFVLFNAESLSQAAGDLASLFGLGGLPLVTLETLYYLRSYALLFAVACFGATPLPKTAAKRIQNSWFGPVLEGVFLVGIWLISTAYLVDGSFSPFLYFRF